MSARIGSARKKFRELTAVLVGKQGLSLKQFISVVLDQLCCTVVKQRNLLLWIRQVSMGWNVV